jgi:pimeloyl-ACP methyl ester carboxylesterase
MVAGFFVWFLTRGQYTNNMLSDVDDQLVKHELAWAGRGRDYAQYQLTLSGQDNKSYAALYRIPASVERVPALVVLHTMDSTKAVFDLLNQVENSSDCAILAVNTAQYLKRDGSGRFLSSNSDLGQGLVSGLHAADLAIAFVRGHSIVDTSAVYLVGIDEASLLAMPAAANHQEKLKGVVCINPDAMMSMRNWGKDDFASPVGWANRIGSLQVLIVTTNGEKDLTEFAGAFPTTASRVIATSQNVPDKSSQGLASAIRWICKDRPRRDTSEFDPGKPKKDQSAVFRK